ncbi:MAG: hypothetical protein LBH73_08300, partial [Spirochaetaceae bacterium]|nr:hypothetical protein [Spirochaetaceae bacterium]
MTNTSPGFNKTKSSLAFSEAAITIRTTSSLGCAGASEAVFIFRGYSIKYTDPDGRYTRNATVAYAHKWSGGNYLFGRNQNYYN